MEIVRIVLRILFFLDAIGLIGLILLQMSEHASLGGAFGAGMASTVFGRDVSRDPKKTATAAMGGLFLILGLVLAIL